MMSPQPLPSAAVVTGRPERPCVALFVTEGTRSERIDAFGACGLRVARCTFLAPDRALSGHRLRRLASLALAVPAVIRTRRQLASAAVFWARDLDVAVLALLARRIASSRAPLVYEVLEVPPAFTGRGPRSFLLRLLERFVLTRSNLLVVGSRALMGHYFAPVQGYAAPWALLGDGIHSDDGIAELCRRLVSWDRPTSLSESRRRILARG